MKEGCPSPILDCTHQVGYGHALHPTEMELSEGVWFREDDAGLQGDRIARRLEARSRHNRCARCQRGPCAHERDCFPQTFHHHRRLGQLPRSSPSCDGSGSSPIGVSQG